MKPADLSALASIAWDREAPICLAMGLLTVADVSAFATLCELLATQALAVIEKNREGFSVFLYTLMVDSAGNEHQKVEIHPAIKLEGDTSVKLRPYLEKFGMDPSSRARLSVPKADEPVSKWAGVLP